MNQLTLIMEITDSYQKYESWSSINIVDTLVINIMAFTDVTVDS